MTRSNSGGGGSGGGGSGGSGGSGGGSSDGFSLCHEDRCESGCPQFLLALTRVLIARLSVSTD